MTVRSYENRMRCYQVFLSVLESEVNVSRRRLKRSLVSRNLKSHPVWGPYDKKDIDLLD